jgi:hypothetical protein
MTLGTTPSESGTTTRSSRLYPRRETSPLVVPGPIAPDGPDRTDIPTPLPEPVVALPTGTGDADPAADAATRAERRQALRAARRRRRLISIGCAVVIALCTAATLLVVEAARVRSVGTPTVTAPARLAVPPVVHGRPLPTRIRSTEILDAATSRGGHP